MSKLKGLLVVKHSFWGWGWVLGGRHIGRRLKEGGDKDGWEKGRGRGSRMEIGGTRGPRLRSGIELGGWEQGFKDDKMDGCGKRKLKRWCRITEK